MLLARCAWHRRYFGYTIVVGVASWRGWSVGLSDGICRRCARRVRAGWLDERRRGADGRAVQRRAQPRSDGSPPRGDEDERFAA